MLRRSREAHHSTDKRVEATVCAPITLGKQFVQTMRRLVRTARWDPKSQCPQSRSGHRHEQ